MKIKQIYIILLLLPLFFSCNDWFDGALPRDRNLEQDQFSSEEGINAVLNGIYRSFSSESLYGGKLTMTTVELMAHYYHYADNLTNQTDYTKFNNISKYLYSEDPVKTEFSAIWKDAYNTIFRINNFIHNVSETSVISAQKRDILLGEAYGLRAYLHFDLFRLFGENNIPYNRSWEVEPQQQLSKDDFFALLEEDLGKAKSLLANDPVITEGIKNQYDSNVTTVSVFESYYRNCRMNYYAVLAFQARELMYKGDIHGAANAAQQTLDACFGEDKPFNWANKLKITEQHNYVFYSEVIFAVNNLELYNRWTTYTGGTKAGLTYTVDVVNLKGNIFKYDDTGGDMSLWEDVRIRQWTASKMGGEHYVSNKFNEYSRSDYYNLIDPIEYFQPLIRTSELFYIIAENEITNGNYSSAMEKLNNFRFNRGSQLSSLPDPEAANKELCDDILETEYYKEFYGEGQVFYFLKRRNTSRIFDANSAGRWTGTPDYIVPLPEIETNI